MINTVLLFHEEDGSISRHQLGDADPMPYTPKGFLSVGKFKGDCPTPIVWTTRRTMEMIRASFAEAPKLVMGFRRLYCFPMPGEYHHLAGTAVTVRDTQVQTPFPLWDTAYLTDAGLHLAMGKSPSADQVFPTLRQGDRSVYTALLQDGLNLLGEEPGGIDGVFGTQTENSVLRFQKRFGLSADGIVGINTWNVLLTKASALQR